MTVALPRGVRRAAGLVLALAVTFAVTTFGVAPAVARSAATARPAGVTLAAVAYYQIQFGHSLRCVHAPNADNGTQLVQRQCDRNDYRQVWALVWIDSKYAMFQNADNGKCINVYNGSTANNVPIILWPCTDGARNNHWWGQPTYSGSNLHWFRAQHSQKCMVVRNASGAENAVLIQYTCTGGDLANDEVTYIHRDF